MPTYINNTNKNITFQIDGVDTTLLPTKTIKTVKVYANIPGIDEISEYPNLAPVLQEDFITGEEGDEVVINVHEKARLIKIINRSEVDITLFYNTSDTQGLTIFSKSGVSLTLTEEMTKDIKKLIIELLEDMVLPRGIVVSQFRNSDD